MKTIHKQMLAFAILVAMGVLYFIVSQRDHADADLADCNMEAMRSVSGENELRYIDQCMRKKGYSFDMDAFLKLPSEMTTPFMTEIRMRKNASAWRRD